MGWSERHLNMYQFPWMFNCEHNIFVASIGGLIYARCFPCTFMGGRPSEGGLLLFPSIQFWIVSVRRGAWHLLLQLPLVPARRRKARPKASKSAFTYMKQQTPEPYLLEIDRNISAEDRMLSSVLWRSLLHIPKAGRIMERLMIPMKITNNVFIQVHVIVDPT